MIQKLILQFGKQLGEKAQRDFFDKLRSLPSLTGDSCAQRTEIPLLKMSFGLFPTAQIGNAPSRSSSWQACRRWRRCRRGAAARTGCGASSYRPPPSCGSSQASSPHHIVRMKPPCSCCRRLASSSVKAVGQIPLVKVALCLGIHAVIRGNSVLADSTRDGARRSSFRLLAPEQRRSSTHCSMSFRPGSRRSGTPFISYSEAGSARTRRASRATFSATARAFSSTPAIGIITTAIFGGRTRPLLSPWGMMMRSGRVARRLEGVDLLVVFSL